MDKYTNQAPKLPPQAKEIERTLIAGLLTDSQKIEDVIFHLPKAEFFYDPKNIAIYGAMLDLYAKRETIDLMTIMQELKRTNNLDFVGGAYGLTQMTIDSPISFNTSYEKYALIIREKWMLRKVILMCSEVMNRCYNNDADIFDEIGIIGKTLNGLEGGAGLVDTETMREIAISTIEKLNEARLGTNKTKSIDMGIDFLGAKDDQGFKQKLNIKLLEGKLYVLAARPSVGKTAFMLQAMMNAHKQDKEKMIVVFSLEMTKKDLIERVIASETGIDFDYIQNPERLNESDMNKIANTESIFNTSIYVDDAPNLNAKQIIETCIRLKRKHKKEIALVCVDYIQIMGSDGGNNREQEVSKNSKALKDGSKTINAPIIALSQLSRDVEKRGGGVKIPNLADLRESGAIEQDADFVMFLFALDEVDGNGLPVKSRKSVGWSIAKNRQGKVDNGSFSWDGAHQRFYNETDYNKNESFKNIGGMPF